MPLSYMVRSDGVEPPTYWFVASCSIQLSYERVEGVIYPQTGARSILSTTAGATPRCTFILRHFRLELGEIIIHTTRSAHLIQLFLDLPTAIQRIIQRTRFHQPIHGRCLGLHVLSTTLSAAHGITGLIHMPLPIPVSDSLTLTSACAAVISLLVTSFCVRNCSIWSCSLFS